MVVINGLVIFQDNDRECWEKLLLRELNEIPPQLLRELGETRVRELNDEGYHLWARMAARLVESIPPSNVH